MDAVARLNQLGWTWRENGVELCVVLNGRTYRVFVPLRRVVVTFENEMAREGYREPPSVGAPSCVGFFGFVSRGISKLGKAAGRAVSRAASTVTRTAAKFASKAVHAAGQVAQNPYVRAGLAAGSFVMPALAPAAVALETANRAYGTYQQARQGVQVAQRLIRRPTNVQALQRAAVFAKARAVPTPHRGGLASLFLR